MYRVQLEDAQGQTSNVAEARVDVLLPPIWRKALRRARPCPL